MNYNNLISDTVELSGENGIKLFTTFTKWLAHLPFTSKVAGSNLSENISMWLEPSPHVKRVKVNALPKVVGLLRVLRFPPTGKVDRVG
jgi:hypothetical protein